jgi:hypothetical protein
MANRWTGNHDAVLELAPQGVDRLLAAIHRKGERTSESGAGPHFLHAAAFNLPLGVAPTSEVPSLRGHLRVQLGPPAVDVPPGGATQRVRASIPLFARFQALPESAPAPEFLHGTLSLTAGVRITTCRGETLAEIGLGASDAVVDFVPAPGSGASAADVALVRSAVPAILGTGLGKVQIALGGLELGSLTIRDLDFRTLGSGSSSAFAVLLALREAPGVPLNADLVNQMFLGSQDDAALALGREFISALFLDLAQGPLAEIDVQGSKFIGAFGVGFTLSYQAKVDPASLALDFQAGRVRVRVSGSGSLSPGGAFGFRVTQHLALGTSGGKLELRLDGGVDVEITQGNALLKWVLGLFTGSIESGLTSSLANLLVALNQELNRVVDEAVGGLFERLALSFVHLGFSSAAIDADGVRVGGRIDIGDAPAVVARLQTRAPSAAAAALELDAFESWIPGGTVERYRFRRWQGEKTAGALVEEHRFVTNVPLESGPGKLQAVAWPPSGWCLEVHGTRFRGSGKEPVSATTCGFDVLTLSMDLSASERLTVRVPDGQGGTLADVDPWGGYRAHAFAGDSEERGFLLAHRPGPAGRAPVQALRKALAARRPGDPAVLALLLVDAPAGSGERIDWAREAPEFAESADPEGGWRKRLCLEPGASTLLGPGGKELWRGRPGLDAEELTQVLAKHAPKRGRGSARLPRLRTLGLGLALGNRIPDFQIPCDGLVATDAVVTAARKLRGRELVLAFWTTWSEASVEELRRLARTAPACGERDRERPIVVGINDGEPRERAAEFLKRQGIDLVLVEDEKRALARRFGIACWPTVVRVDREGRIAGVRLGLEPEPARGSKGELAYAGSVH